MNLISHGSMPLLTSTIVSTGKCSVINQILTRINMKESEFVCIKCQDKFDCEFILFYNIDKQLECPNCHRKYEEDNIDCGNEDWPILNEIEI